MGIKGFQGTSLLDFPQRVASLVFYGGCNLTCPFCHNPSLVLSPEEYPDYPVASLLDELGRRRNFIDGVVVSGGEPTIDNGLLPFLRQVKALGLQVKLDTNGLAPSVLQQALEEQLLDYVAMDLKTAPHRYGEMHTGPVCVDSLHACIGLLIGGAVDYEFRTTCVPGFVEQQDVEAMGEALRGAKHWVLQQYVAQHALDEGCREVCPHSEDTLRKFAESARTYVDRVGLRGL